MTLRTLPTLDPYVRLVGALLAQAVRDASGPFSTWSRERDPRCTPQAARAYLRGCPELMELIELCGCDAPTILRALRSAAGLEAA